MSKRGGFPGGMGGFGGMNINNLMKEAKKMQAEMQKSQEELATKEFDSTAGGGAISVKVTGEKGIEAEVFLYNVNGTLESHSSTLNAEFSVLESGTYVILIQGECWYAEGEIEM